MDATLRRRGQLVLKRGLDVCGSAMLLVLSLPLMLATALLVKSTSAGPVLFRQVRVGQHGRPFVMYKFRTMLDGADAMLPDVRRLNEMEGPVFKLRRDPRVTTVGRWLRAWSLDELPQLWNVVRGEMSLVGPRPPLAAEVARYDGPQRRRLAMKPGMTGAWQVAGRNQVSFDDWMRLDLAYIDTWSLKTDLIILARTIPAVLSRRGAW